MEIAYKNKPIQTVCEDYKKAARKYNTLVADKLHAALNFIQAAENIRDVAKYPPFHFHDLKGDRAGCFAMDLGRRLGYRLIVRPKLKGRYAAPEEVFGTEALEIVVIQLEEVTNHYE